MTNQRKIDVNPFNALPAILMMVVALVILWYVANGIFTLLAYAAPVFLVLAAIINYKVIVNYGKMLFNLLKRNPLMGVAAVALSLFFYPVVCFFLFGKALVLRKIGSVMQDIQNKTQGEYVEYEDIPEEPSTIIELPPVQQRKEDISRAKSQRKNQQETQYNDYEELFDEDA